MDDIGRNIAVDDAGNSYVTGEFQGAVTFGSFTLTSAGGKDVFVVEYDAGGNVIWARSAGGVSDDVGFGIAVDTTGNIYVTGTYDSIATFESVTLTSVGFADIFVAKYDAGGNVLWAESAGGTSCCDEGLAISVDAAGNSYVTGRYLGTATFGPFTLTLDAITFDIFVVKYDTVGNVVWARAGGEPFFGLGTDIVADAVGNSYVTGIFSTKATFGSFVLTSAGSFDIFVVKYDTSGNVLWARSAGGTSTDSGTGIAVTPAGNSYVTGSYKTTAAFGSTPLTSTGLTDIFVAKYDSKGSLLWARSAGGKSDDLALEIAVDTAGNAYTTGAFQGTATFDSFTVIDPGVQGIFVSKYDSSGDVLWVQTAGGTSAGAGIGIGVDAVGNSYATGRFEGTAGFGPFTLTSAGAADIFVAKYSAPPPPPPIPAISEWGLSAMALLMLTLGILVLSGRRPVAG